MQTVRITTSQNIDIDYEVAGIGERVLARLIDFGIFVVLYILGLIAYLTMGNVINAIVSIVVVIIGYAIVIVFYDLVCETLMNGQSIGKRIMKIKVISLDGSRPTFGQYLLRWLFRIVDFLLSGQVCGLICAAVTDKQQRVGDVVAGTTLIRTTQRTTHKSLAFKPVEDEYQPVYKEMSLLNDKDIVLIHEVIRNYAQTGNSVIVYNAAIKVMEILSVTKAEGMDDLAFLKTIVKDYNHLATQADVL